MADAEQYRSPTRVNRRRHGGPARPRRRALAWERLWPALWPATGGGRAVPGVALFDLLPRLPGMLHALTLAVLRGAARVGLCLRPAPLPPARPRRRDAGASRRRAASRIVRSPRSRTGSAVGAGDAATAALWQAHRQRMATGRRAARHRRPAASLCAPRSLRARAPSWRCCCSSARSTPAGLARAVVARGDAELRAGADQPPAVALDIWMTPPDYTGLPPQFLPPGASAAADRGADRQHRPGAGAWRPRPAAHLDLDDTATRFRRIDDSNFKGSATICARQAPAVTQDGRALGAGRSRSCPTCRRPSPSPSRHSIPIAARCASNTRRMTITASRASRPSSSASRTIRPRRARLDLPLPGQHLKDARGRELSRPDAASLGRAAGRDPAPGRRRDRPDRHQRDDRDGAARARVPNPVAQRRSSRRARS